ncbi:hypothetical protein GDO86_015790 [Hymenochirus boettgeri]|uniref:Uncharacterized protein n=1 Tax=Hymenochirus boettgeri TaxID=247094 RepID=A0A8T2JUE8_9PIPI|nr:hypothetical protein GDO86_015790 [Hymenochirus boettgeri]
MESDVADGTDSASVAVAQGPQLSDETDADSVVTPLEKAQTERALGIIKEAAAGLLREVCYNGPLCNTDFLVHSAERGATNLQFTSLCVWLVTELKAVSSLVENISPTDGPADAETFQLELSGVVKELHCPYTSLTSGEVTSRLTSLYNCLQLLVFLCTELQAARLMYNKMVPEIPSSEAVQELMLVGEALEVPKPFPAISVNDLMQMLKIKIEAITATIPDSIKSSPLLKTELQPAQWERLSQLHWQLLKEYECRIRMLLTRFDVTVQSFHWCERSKEHGAKMREVFWPLRQSLRLTSHVTISHLLAAREEDSRILHTCSAALCQKTCSSIKKVLMTGSIPDRGGRPNEIEPPMPTWAERREGGGKQHRWGKRNKRKRN